MAIFAIFTKELFKTNQKINPIKIRKGCIALWIYLKLLGLAFWEFA